MTSRSSSSNMSRMSAHPRRSEPASKVKGELPFVGEGEHHAELLTAASLDHEVLVVRLVVHGAPVVLRVTHIIELELRHELLRCLSGVVQRRSLTECLCELMQDSPSDGKAGSLTSPECAALFIFHC